MNSIMLTLIWVLYLEYWRTEKDNNKQRQGACWQLEADLRDAMYLELFWIFDSGWSDAPTKVYALQLLILYVKCNLLLNVPQTTTKDRSDKSVGIYRDQG